MLLYGTIQNLQLTSNCEVFCFTSLNESYERLNLLPPREFGYVYDYQFDMNYANYILSNDNVFFDLMRIIFNLYIGKDVFILVDDEMYAEGLNDSLLKFIQQRYGYNACRINSLEDFVMSEESGFTEMGLINLDYDKNRLSYMVESMRLSNGGTPYGCEQVMGEN